VRIHGWSLETAAALVDDFDMASTADTGAEEVPALAADRGAA
jgi:hypothetical protein